jgi:hypothetical protein
MDAGVSVRKRGGVSVAVMYCGQAHVSPAELDERKGRNHACIYVVTCWRTLAVLHLYCMSPESSSISTSVSFFF